MLHLALSTYLHILSAITICCCIVLQLLTLKSTLSLDALNLLKKADNTYGIASFLVIGTGLLNWLYFGKGEQYYSNNSLFILKFSLFAVVGLLSIYPTIIITQKRKKLRNSSSQSIALVSYQKIKWLMRVELCIMIVLPLLAELMANGFDL